MAEFTEKEMNTLAKYIQKKERRLAALNVALSQANNQMYATELGEIAVLVYEDKLPGSLDLIKSMPKIYPPLKAPKEEKKEEDESDSDDS